MRTDKIKNQLTRRKFSKALYEVFNDFDGIDIDSKNISAFKDLDQEYKLRFIFTDSKHKNDFNDYSSGIIANNYKEQNLKSKTVSISDNVLN